MRGCEVELDAVDPAIPESAALCFVHLTKLLFLRRWPKCETCDRRIYFMPEVRRRCTACLGSVSLPTSEEKFDRAIAAATIVGDEAREERRQALAEGNEIRNDECLCDAVEDE